MKPRMNKQKKIIKCFGKSKKETSGYAQNGEKGHLDHTKSLKPA